MMMQRCRGLRVMMVVCGALAMSVSGVPGRADSLSVGPTDEGTRLIDGNSPPTLDHPLQLLNVLVDSADQLSVDSIVEFDIASITTVPHGARVQSATLILDVAGAQTLAGPGSLSVNGYPDGDGLVGPGDFLKKTTFLGSTGNLPDGSAGSENIPFRFDVTNLIQSIASKGTMRFVGFHLEGPGSDSEAWVWGLGAPDLAERPRLEVTFSAGSVPEPPGALLIGLGIAGPAALGWWCGRRRGSRTRAAGSSSVGAGPAAIGGGSMG
jgi:hypothetical protein